ncbi:hypothetical protein [Lentibacillus juripiscarius]|uniref:Uncharacterized protein n=1 Tax=Lentibacillus juripiscarius TaxID=257446 RepID=A0ABW5V4M4_9BACI
MNQCYIIKVQEDELGMKRAFKEAAKARTRGYKPSFDLRHIKDSKTKVELMRKISNID